MAQKIDYELTLKDEASRIFNQFSKGVESKSLSMKNIISGIGPAIGAAFSVYAIKDFIDEANQAATVQAKVDAVIKSTGGAAGITSEEVNKLADSMQQVTIHDDDAVKSAAALLLTFTNIKDNVFPQATETVLNMSDALGQDLKESSIQVGKALNDPIQGVTALRRVGVQLNDQQEASVKKFVAQNNIAGAQKVILAELEKEFGGVSRAIAATPEGQYKQLGNDIGDLKKEVGALLNEVIRPLIPELRLVVKELTEELPKGLQQAEGTIARSLQLIIAPLGVLQESLGSVGIGDSHGFQQMFDELQKIREGAVNAANEQGLLSGQIKLTSEEAKKQSAAVTAAQSNIDAWGKLLGWSGDQQKNLSQSTKKTTEETQTLSEKIKTLKTELDSLDPEKNKEQWMKLSIEIEQAQIKLSLFNEKAKIIASGGSTTEFSDLFFGLRFTDSVNAAQAETDQFFKKFNDDSRKMFGADVSAEVVNNYRNQAQIIQDIHQEYLQGQLTGDLQLVYEWEAKSIEAAQGREDTISQIHTVAEKRRSDITAKYLKDEMNKYSIFFDSIQSTLQSTLGEGFSKLLGEQNSVIEQFIGNIGSRLISWLAEQITFYIAQAILMKSVQAAQLAASTAATNAAMATTAAIAAPAALAVNIASFGAAGASAAATFGIAAASQAAAMSAVSLLKFHDGGTMIDGGRKPLASDEYYAILRNNERVIPPERIINEGTTNNSSSVQNVTYHYHLNFNAPVEGKEFVRSGIKKIMRELGARNIADVRFNENSGIAIAQ